LADGNVYECVWNLLKPSVPEQIMTTVVVFGGAGFLGRQPVHRLTAELDLLKVNNVVSGTLAGFRELNIQPKTVEEVVPTYIGPRASGPH
jgi:hypothetical protein